MAISFTANGTDWHTANNAVPAVDVDTFTVFFRFNVGNDGSSSFNTGVWLSAGNQFNFNDDVWNLNFRSDGGTNVACQFQHWFSTSAALHETARDITHSVWHNIALSYDRSNPSTSPTIYIDGTADTWSTTDTAGVGTVATKGGSAGVPDTLFTGQGNSGQFGPYWTHEVTSLACDWAFWNRQLSAAEMAGLSKGRWSPWHPGFRRGLKFFYPGFDINDAVDRVAGVAITRDVLSTVAHPPVVHPMAAPNVFSLGVPAAGAPPGGIDPAVALYHLRHHNRAA